MASSSSEDFDQSIPEVVYECMIEGVSMIDENNCKKDGTFVVCPLCKQMEENFYCAECIKNGNFLHSKKKCFERFADKKVTKYKLDAEKAQIVQRYEELFSKRIKIENLKREICKSKEKLRLLKASVQSCKETIIRDTGRIKELEKNNSEAASTQGVFIDKLLSMHEHHKVKQAELVQANCKLKSAQSALQTFIQRRTQELTTHIFPITEVTSSQYHKNSSSDEGQFAELEEAQKFIYYKGQWILTRSGMDDFQYSVVEPCIPSSGDYSDYTKWCAEHMQGMSRDSLSVIDKGQFDRAYGISAALAYTAQFVSILAFYMDAYVPKKCSFSDFCGNESETKFLHKVAKLNTNIISLCLSRGVDVSKLSAHQTIQNLLLLLESTKTKEESMLPHNMQDLMKSIENSISENLLSTDESDSDGIEAEYVHVSEDEEFLPPDDDQALHHDTLPEQSSLISSVFSLFKAAAGQK